MTEIKDQLNKVDGKKGLRQSELNATYVLKNYIKQSEKQAEKEGKKADTFNMLSKEDRLKYADTFQKEKDEYMQNSKNEQSKKEVGAIFDKIIAALRNIPEQVSGESKGENPQLTQNPEVGGVDGDRKNESSTQTAQGREIGYPNEVVAQGGEIDTKENKDVIQTALLEQQLEANGNSYGEFNPNAGAQAINDQVASEQNSHADAVSVAAAEEAGVLNGNTQTAQGGEFAYPNEVVVQGGEFAYPNEVDVATNGLTDKMYREGNIPSIDVSGMIESQLAANGNPYAENPELGAQAFTEAANKEHLALVESKFAALNPALKRLLPTDPIDRVAIYDVCNKTLDACVNGEINLNDKSVSTDVVKNVIIALAITKDSTGKAYFNSGLAESQLNTFRQYTQQLVDRYKNDKSPSAMV